MTVDMTFCASPNCKNECGRMMQPEQKAFLDKYPNNPVYYSYFCGEPKDDKMVDLSPLGTQV